MSDIIQKPFADYKNFEDCVQQNKDKANPEAYCGEIKHRTEDATKAVRDPDAVCGELWFNGTDAQREGFGSGTEGRSRNEKPPSKWWDDCKSKIGKECPFCMKILKQDNSRFIIYGPASVEIIDKERDKIRAEGLQVALPQLLKRARFSRDHQDILIGEILNEFKTDDGHLYKTGVDSGVLHVVGEVWDDTRAGRETRQQILSKQLRSFSISGEVLEAQKICTDDTGCYRDIAKLDLHAVTICERGMNPEAKFDIVQKSDSITFIFKNKLLNNIKETDMDNKDAKTQDIKKEEPKETLESKFDKFTTEFSKFMTTIEKTLVSPTSKDPPQQYVSKEEFEALKKKLAEQDELTRKVMAGTQVQTPRPDLAKNAIAGQPTPSAIPSVSELQKMSFRDIAAIYEEGDE